MGVRASFAACDGRPAPVAPSAVANIQYQSAGFETPVSLRQHEKVVIGTTTMGDKALIVYWSPRTSTSRRPSAPTESWRHPYV